MWNLSEYYKVELLWILSEYYKYEFTTRRFAIYLIELPVKLCAGFSQKNILLCDLVSLVITGKPSLLNNETVCFRTYKNMLVPRKKILHFFQNDKGLI